MAEPPEGLTAGLAFCVISAPTYDAFDLFRGTVDTFDSEGDDVLARERSDALELEPVPEQDVTSGPIWGWDSKERPVY